MSRTLSYAIPLLVGSLLSCAPLPLDRAQNYAYVVFDPSGGALPLPNDALLDTSTGRLDFPTDDPTLTETEVALRHALNQDMGWSTRTPITAQFSDAVDPNSITENTVQIWEWGANPIPVEGLEFAISEDGLELTVPAPDDGWTSGAVYFAVVSSAPSALQTQTGRTIGADAAFTYLQSKEPIDSFDNQRAFPGTTREERMQNAATLENIRKQLTPMFTFLEDTHGLMRTDVAAMWRFSVTESVELLMDPDSEAVPIPFDILLNPNTNRIELPISTSDRQLEADAKAQANRLNGFSISADMLFDTTGPLDPNTVNTDNIQLWDIGQTPVQVPIEVRPMSETGEAPCWETPVSRACKHIVISLTDSSIPLQNARAYAIAVGKGLHGANGLPVRAMSLGHMMHLTTPIAQDDTSMVTGLDNESSVRVEDSRQKVSVLFDALGRETMLTAWPFTTLDPIPQIVQSSDEARQRNFSSPPTVTSRKPPYHLWEDDALSDLFPGTLNPAPAIYWPRTNNIKTVIEGTIPHLNFLDPITRRWTELPKTEPLHFMATIPEGTDGPYPVVIFGHAIVTDRRFLMLVAGEFAKRGYASVAIDFPYHGERIACVESSLVAVPNFFPSALRSLLGFEDDLIWLPPCESGDNATCSPTGECLDPQGKVEPFNSFPIIDLQPASGAAFMDIADIPHIPDHFQQAFVDLGVLKHSLKNEDWTVVFGESIQTDSFVYTGQSMGSIIGFPWVATQSDIETAVFNVPGSNLVGLFRDSTYFSPQVAAALDDLDIQPGSYEEVRLFAIASWLIDTIDPHSLARTMRDSEQPALIQMGKVTNSIGDVIIPNYTTENLGRVSEIPIIQYPSALHADLIVPGLGDAMLRDMGAFIDGELNP